LAAAPRGVGDRRSDAAIAVADEEIAEAVRAAG
jgi:hypothetical protein